MVQGKPLWSDGQSKKINAWKTTFLFLMIIFLMNPIRILILSTEIDLFELGAYLVLAIASGLVYVYYSLEPDRMKFRTRIYKEGILTWTYVSKGMAVKPREMFFSWERIDSMRFVEKRIVSKKEFLEIIYDSDIHSVDIEHKEEFISACEKLGKKVVG
ncbi:MAG: hypothetical protein ABIG39_00880 [Candidatus Micrarchaeota archaeon]